jgi:hypothetical protein
LFFEVGELYHFRLFEVVELGLRQRRLRTWRCCGRASVVAQHGVGGGQAAWPYGYKDVARLRGVCGGKCGGEEAVVYSRR